MSGARAGDALRVALLGYGLGGRSFHAPVIAATPGMRLTCVVTGNEARAAQARAEHPGAQVVAADDHVWSHRGEFDLVVISTPNRTHVPLALAALGAGLPTVVDKPLAATVMDARRVVDAARRAGVPLSVYQNRRFDGDYRTLLGLRDTGTLGTIHRFESRLERWRPALKGGWRELASPEEAGGLLYDLGTHLIDQALYLLGPVTQVYAEVRRLRPGAETDDDVFLALTHASGARAHLWTSVLAADHQLRFRVLGSRGAYMKYGSDPQEAALRGGQVPGGEGWGVESRDDWGTLTDDTGSRAIATEAGAYQDFYAGMARALRGGAPVPVDPDDAIATLAVIEAAQRSAREERVVAIEQ
jgi:scyllo-inositol 2-dehydrogenase (NADP+)